MPLSRRMVLGALASAALAGRARAGQPTSAAPDLDSDASCARRRRPRAKALPVHHRGHAIPPTRAKAVVPKHHAPARSVVHWRASHAKPPHLYRPYAGAWHAVHPWHIQDHRWGRPNPAWLRRYPRAPMGPPGWWWYRPYYSRWWVHPWWRWRFATAAVVEFTFAVQPWTTTWTPPPRSGWTWVPGHMVGEAWIPGHWRPVEPAPAGYVFVPGWWEGDLYIEGYWRLRDRDDDWSWEDGTYLEDGTVMRGHWRPTSPPPAGYIWEPGFWDGESWIGGFWRPARRSGYTWESAYYDEDGVFSCGYWYPTEEREGQIWIPGWFDGNTWIEGEWVSEEEYNSTDVDDWEPEPGYDDGWDAEDGSAPDGVEVPEQPLALPVTIDGA